MAMCKECSAVVGVAEIENGICKTCIENGVIVEPIVNSSVVEKDIPLINFGNPFSFKNRSGRMDYFVYGVLVPYAIIIIPILLMVTMAIDTRVIILPAIFVALLIGLPAVVRRSRDTQNSPIVMVILSIIPYVNIIAMLYLLFAGSKYNKA
jgi:hypothetical protein